MNDENQLRQFGEKLGTLLVGGGLVELVGDVGAGKTTLTKAIAEGMGIPGPIQSPTFTISNRYTASNGVELAHYDFYRLGDAGVMGDELVETIDDERTVTVIEWADIVAGVLPADRLTINILPTSETSRELTLTSGGVRSRAIMEQLK